MQCYEMPCFWPLAVISLTGLGSPLFRGMQVTDDEELMAWYNEIKEKGHPDVKEGWFELKDIASLVKILATMAWIGCGSKNHAACCHHRVRYTGESCGHPSNSHTVRASWPHAHYIFALEVAGTVQHTCTLSA